MKIFPSCRDQLLGHRVLICQELTFLVQPCHEQRVALAQRQTWWMAGSFAPFSSNVLLRLLCSASCERTWSLSHVHCSRTTGVHNSESRMHKQNHRGCSGSFQIVNQHIFLATAPHHTSEQSLMILCKPTRGCRPPRCRFQADPKLRCRVILLALCSPSRMRQRRRSVYSKRLL